ncbi:MAG: molybdopterin-dependent oxidoreductase [Ectothiorhodospiraceae bacterium]|nr:molybdopterin-dependent oxidoreductase [Ectothiorhodospiraceae bacterium]
MAAQPALETRPSVCPLDCPDTCSLAVTVDGGRIVDVRGSDANRYTAGVICEKVAKYYPEFVHGARRLRTPLLRTGPRGSGAFRPIGWDEALDRVHDGIAAAVAAHGPQSVLPLNYAGPHGQLAVASMDRRFFHRLGATLVDRGPLCGGVRGTAYSSLFGNAPGMAPEQAVDADTIVVWGNNVTVSNLHFARVMRAARDRGARVAVVDPKRTRIAEQAHLFVQIHPGTDVVLAFALAAELERRGLADRDFVARWVEGYEPYMARAREYSLDDAARICRLPRDVVDALVELYAGAKRLVTSIGNGIERGRSGGSGLRAILALHAITGQLGRPGAGIVARPALAVPTTPGRLQRPDLVPPGTRTVNIVDVGRLLLDDTLDPPFKAVFVYNHNPVATHPDQNRMRRALSREDLFVVGCDVVMTDSMAYADVVLPAASHFEFDDIYVAYGHNHLLRAEPVIPCVGESLPNTEIFRRLAARFGFDEPIFTESDAELIDAAIDGADPRLGGAPPHALPLDRSIPFAAPSGEPVLMCNTVSPATKSGRIELYSEDMERRFGRGLPAFDPVPASRPLTLISPSSSKRTNATFGSDPASAGLEMVEIHPHDARPRGVADGDEVRVWNERGEVVLRARVTEAVAPGVVYSPKGTWLETSPTGQTINALLDADLRVDLVEGACYNDTFVDLAPRRSS